MLLDPRCDMVPAHAVVQRQIRTHAKTVLREKITVGCGLIECGRRLLRIEVRQTEQEVGVVVARGLTAGSEEREGPVRDKIRSLLNPVPDVGTSELEGVITGCK